MKAQSNADRKTIGDDIAAVEFRWPLGMPVCRSLGHGLWEVRSSLSGNRISRVIFVAANGKMALLHGFIKKTNKTPVSDIELALRRLKEMTT